MTTPNLRDTSASRNRAAPSTELLAPLEQMAANSPNLVANHDARFEVDGRELMSCPAICLSARAAATRPSASAFSPASTATNPKAFMPGAVHSTAEAQAGTGGRLLPVVLPGLQSDRLRGRHAVFALRQGFEPRILEALGRTGSAPAGGGTAIAFVPRASFPCTPTTPATAFTVLPTARR